MKGERTTPMSADGLIVMLAKKHADDVFVAECKDGPTHARAHRRLDAWVLLKTWSPITTIGYEVKVSRSDWQRDDKVHDYMPLCHLLYIVAPKGVVPMDSLPSGVGLMEPVGEAGRLQVRRKAARREIALPAELMVYVLMCRAKITRESLQYDPTNRNWRTEELRKWVDGKGERWALSYAVSQKIRNVFEEQEQRLRTERTRNDTLQTVQERIADLGFDVNQPVHAWQVKERLDKFNRTVDSRTLQRLRNTATMLTEVVNALESMKAGVTSDEEVA